jgi:chromate transporter
MDGIALGQVTPGPIVITATFVGYQIGGLVGAIVGTLGIFTPSFIILLALAPHYDRLQWSLLFRRAVRGAVVCFVGLLLATTARFALAVPWDFKSAVIACLAFLALRLRTDIIWVVLAGSVISAIVL